MDVHNTCGDNMLLYSRYSGEGVHSEGEEKRMGRKNIERRESGPTELLLIMRKIRY